MRTRSTLPAQSASSSSASSKAGSAEPAGAAGGTHAGAGPGTAPRVGQRRPAQQAGLDGPPLREAPALRPSPQAHLRSAGFGGAQARPALLSPQETADFHALLEGPAAPAHHGPHRPNLPSRQELARLAALLDSPAPSHVPITSAPDGFVPRPEDFMRPAPLGHAHPGTGVGADNAGSASLPMGLSNSGGFLPSLEALIHPARHGPAHREMPRPTTPELLGPLRDAIDAVKSRGRRGNQHRGLGTIEAALLQAVQQPQRMRELESEGISLQSHDPTSPGQPAGRASELTPLLEQAERRALVHLQGLMDADLPALERAAFVASLIRERLAQERVAGGQPRTLAQPAGSTRPEKVVASIENTQLSRLAAAYAGKALGLDARNIELLRQRAVGQTGGWRRHHLKLRDLSERHGPLAVALVHQLYDTAWVAEQDSSRTAQGGAKAANHVPARRRQAFVEALLQAGPGVMQKLIDAAHDPDRDVLASVCDGLDAETADRPEPNVLTRALERLQGQSHAMAAYAGAPPADQALRWLQSKAPSATLG